MRGEKDLVLAIEPECYRRWVEDARQAVTAGLLEKAYSPEAAARLEPTKRNAGDVAVVNLSGFITQKPSVLSLLFGGTSAEWFASTVAGAMADPSIGAVVMNVDSPGGTVAGLTEAATTIRASRGAKPLLAVANPTAASGGYWLASQADEIAMMPSGEIGSIGVKTVHVDESQALKQAGLSVTEITYGRRKVEDSSAGPLTEEARASIQARVDYFGHLFEADVAKGRRVTVATVRTKYGEGAMFTAKDALAAGLVDRVATLDEVLAGLVAGKRTGPRAMVDWREELAARAALAGVTLGE